jgi:hypothetical protein
MCLIGTAVAAPPPDADPALHDWFERQRSVSGAWCCDISDGHILSGDAWRSAGSSYEVQIDGRWYSVPDDTLRDPAGGPNPTHQAIVWYRKIGGRVVISCFAPGLEL